MPTLQYNGFEGSAEIDTDTLICRGKVLFIDDLVTYKANSPAELVQEFHAAVDDYVETCAQVGKAPQKPCKGQFNVRVTPELHRQAQLRATLEETSLNAVVASALEHYLHAPTQIALAAKLVTPLIETNSGTGNVVFFRSQSGATLGNNEPRAMTSTSGASLSKTLQIERFEEPERYVH